MSGFRIGDRVECVGPPPGRILAAPLPGQRFCKLGEVYTVRAVRRCKQPAPCSEAIMVDGVVNQVSPSGLELAFFSDNFRLVKRDAIELFRAMCASPKPLVPCGD